MHESNTLRTATISDTVYIRFKLLHHRTHPHCVTNGHCLLCHQKSNKNDLRSMQIDVNFQTAHFLLSLSLFSSILPSSYGSVNVCYLSPAQCQYLSAYLISNPSFFLSLITTRFAFALFRPFSQED